MLAYKDKIAILDRNDDNDSFSLGIDAKKIFKESANYSTDKTFVTVYDNSDGILTESKKYEDARLLSFPTYYDNLAPLTNQAFIVTEKEVIDGNTGDKLFDISGYGVGAGIREFKNYDDGSYACIEYLCTPDSSPEAQVMSESVIHYRKNNEPKKALTDKNKIISLDVFNDSKIVYFSVAPPVTPEKQIYASSNGATGELYYYNGKEKNLIADNVTYMFSLKSHSFLW